MLFATMDALALYYKNLKMKNMSRFFLDFPSTTQGKKYHLELSSLFITWNEIKNYSTSLFNFERIFWHYLCYRTAIQIPYERHLISSHWEAKFGEAFHHYLLLFCFVARLSFDVLWKLLFVLNCTSWVNWSRWFGLKALECKSSPLEIHRLWIKRLPCSSYLVYLSQLVCVRYNWLSMSVRWYKNSSNGHFLDSWSKARMSSQEATKK